MAHNVQRYNNIASGYVHYGGTQPKKHHVEFVVADNDRAISILGNQTMQ